MNGALTGSITALTMYKRNPQALLSAAYYIEYRQVATCQCKFWHSDQVLCCLCKITIRFIRTERVYSKCCKVTKECIPAKSKLKHLINPY